MCTVVFFHAHPDDEVLLTGGTMARLAAEGHRVVLVTATIGEAGLTGDADATAGLAQIRSAELSQAAATLGCSRVVSLGFGDSGSDDTAPPRSGSFCDTSIELAADRLASLLDAERADALTIYDPVGGYGHRDHIRVHHVGRDAAARAGTPLVLEATIDRQALQRGLRLARWLVPKSDAFAPERFASLYTARHQLTHRVDVTRYLDEKRAALAAHASHTRGGSSERTLAWLLRLPKPLFRLALGSEWYVEHGRTPGKPLLSDLLASLS